MREVLYLLKKIRRYDPGMLGMILLYTLCGAFYPFIWVVVPSHLLSLPVGTSLPYLATIIAGAGGLAICAAFVLAYLRGNYRMRMNNIRYYLLRDVMRYSLAMPYEYTLDKDRLDKIKKANTSVIGPNHGGGGLILGILAIASKLLAFLGFAGLFWMLEGWILAGILLLVVLTYLLKLKGSAVEYETWEEAELLESPETRLLGETLNPAYKKDFQVYSLYTIIKQYVSDLIARRDTLLGGLAGKLIGYDIIAATLNLLRDLAVYIYLVRAYLAGRIDLGAFYLYSTSLLALIVLAQSLAEDFSNMNRFRKQFRHFIDLDVDQTAEAVPPPARQPAAQGVKVEVQDVSFYYPGQEKPVLEHFSLTIHPGEKLALVGENGSGKSTLVKLLCRLYTPATGRILFDGVDIRELSESEFLARLSVVFQDVMILPFTIRENITMAEDVDRARLAETLEKSGLQPLVDGLPDGSESYLLRVLDDRGLDFSGGQRQKLLLARALYKTSAGFLILDEPTAALDPLAEKALYETYHELTAGKSVLFISHRLASTQFCDRIIYLAEGRVLEEGTHQALLDARGAYYELYEVQGKNYRTAEGGL